MSEGQWAILTGVSLVLLVFGSVWWAGHRQEKRRNQHGSPYEPYLFLRQRNNGTYFVDIRTFKSQDIHWGELIDVSYTYNWRQVEAGTTQEQADQVMAQLTAEIKAEKDHKKSLEYTTLKEGGV